MLSILEKTRVKLPLMVMVLVLLALALWQVSNWVRINELDKLQQRVKADIGRYSVSLRNELDKYRSLPKLLATNAQLHGVLADADDLLKAHRLNLYLEDVSYITGASDIYLMAATGKTLAASNWQQVNSFVGRSFHYRPYFQQAMKGEPGRYFALGTTSLKRGYYFSHPIRIGAQVTGVIVVKIDLNDIEEQWSDPLVDLLVTDIDDVIFISTRPQWKFKTLQPLASEDLQRIVSSRRYGDQPLASLPILKRRSYGEEAQLIKVLEQDLDDPQTLQGLSGAEYLLMSEWMPEAELNIVALARLTTVKQQVLSAVLLAGFVCVILVLLIAFLVLRRKVVSERLRFKQQATEALEASEARVRAIIDNTQAGLITLDGQGRIESFNPTAEALFGYRFAELMRGYFSQLINHRDRAQFWRLLTRPESDAQNDQNPHSETPLAQPADSRPESAARAAQAPMIETLGRRKDGSLFPMELSIGQIDQHGEKKFIATIHDVSVRQQYEQHLRRARDELEARVAERTDELVKANERLRQEIIEHENTQNELIQTAKMAVLGQLSAGINHELNQPLTAIRAYADNARAFLQLDKLAPALENLTEISALTERMAKIVASLKVFSRKSSGKAEPVSLKSVREGAMAILYGRLDKAAVTVVWPESLDEVYVMGDTVRLEQVVVNLLSNALQAMEQQPEKRIEVSCECQSQAVKLAFRDYGPGIDLADLEKVFEPFYTTKQVDQGLGLGLSISHRIVDSLGGRLTVNNHPQGGAIFTMELQRATDRPQRAIAS